MAKNQITKEEIKKLMEIPGKVRGQVFITDLQYVKEKEGEKGVELLKKKMEEWGNLIDYEKTRVTEWYPVGLRAVSLLAIKEIFGWGEKEIFALGNSAPKHSFIVRLLLKYFISVPVVAKEAAKMWQRHYTVGALISAETKEEQKYTILRLTDFKIHPILCSYYRGYFLRIGQYVVRSPKITNEEAKCMFRGDPYHEYIISWE